MAAVQECYLEVCREKDNLEAAQEDRGKGAGGSGEGIASSCCVHFMSLLMETSALILLGNREGICRKKPLDFWLIDADSAHKGESILK